MTVGVTPITLTLFVHLLAFAAYAGAFAALHGLLAMARGGSRPEEARRVLLGAGSITATVVALPAILVSLITGLLMLSLQPYYLQAGWMHAKIGLVVLLVVLAHLDMFLVRKWAREGDPEGRRAGRHRLYAIVGGVLIVAVVFLVTVKPF